jgi:site-specific recombinase XerC
MIRETLSIRRLQIYGKTVCRHQKWTANKLQDPRLMQIHFHTFRQSKATIEHHQTRDILQVMNLLGHRNIETTMVYTQIISFESDEYHSAIARTVEEARKLPEQSFEYACQKEDIMLFRKRKQP